MHSIFAPPLLHTSHPAAASSPRKSSLPPSPAGCYLESHPLPSLSSGAHKAATALLGHLKQGSEQEEWLLDVLKRRLGVLRTLAAEERKLGSGSGRIGEKPYALPDDGLAGCLRRIQEDASRKANDWSALESFIKNQLFQPLEKASKARTEKLKKKYKHLTADVLQKLLAAEKTYSRARGDLEAEQRRHSQLIERQRLDLAHEIEKVEIELRKCASTLGMRQAEYDVARSRAIDTQRSWTSEWENFRILARQAEYTRQLELQKAITEWKQAEILVKEADLARQDTLLAQLGGWHALQDISQHGIFHGLEPLRQADTSACAVMPPNAIVNYLWPQSSIDASRLDTLSRPTPTPERRPISPGHLASSVPASFATPTKQRRPEHLSLSMKKPLSILSASSGSVSPASTSSSDREFGEEMFSVRRKAVPIRQILTPDEMDLLSETPKRTIFAEPLQISEGADKQSDLLTLYSKEPSKPLPGLPDSVSPGATLSVSYDPDGHELDEEKVEQLPVVHVLSATGSEGDLPEEPSTEGATPDKPPSLPSFRDLRLGSFGWDHEAV